MDNHIDLNGTLRVLEGFDSNKSLLFINPDANLQTFFTYKGTLIEINKMNLRKQLGKVTDKDNSEEIRINLSQGIQKGYWLVFDMDKNAELNLDSFFKTCSFYNKDTFFNFQNFKSKDFMLKNGILKEEDDKDFFGNSGGYNCHDTFKICYLCCCKIEEIEKLKKNIDTSNFEIYIVK